MTEPSVPTSSSSNPRSAARKPLLLALAGGVAVCALAAGGYGYFYASRFVSTDNAYTAVEIAQITPSVSGTILDVPVVDTQHVRKGDVLVLIDDRDARLALQEAQAELGRAMRRVKGYAANDDSLSAQIAAREADEKRAQAQLVAAQADFERARIDLERREALEKSGSVSGDELTRARNAYTGAQAALDVANAALAQARANRATAKGTREANATLIEDTTADENPEVVLARARRDRAQLDLERTVIRAPIDGIVAKRQVQLGQRVQAGAPLLAVVPLHDVHVDANFKEVQLEKVKNGQRVEVTADLYGSAVTYHGVVEGFSGGTGSAFSAIPAQNATGNWIKVVQRLPVRIRLDPQELAAKPLNVGLSMSVRIDTTSRS
jgi:membrane fusion protein (multidrug efflux system)